MAALTEDGSYVGWSSLGVTQPVSSGGKLATTSTAQHAGRKALGFTVTGDWEIEAEFDIGSATVASMITSIVDGFPSLNGYSISVGFTLTCVIQRLAGGSPTTIGSFGPGGSGTYRLQFTSSSGLHEVFRNGVSLGTATDTTYTNLTTAVVSLITNDNTTPMTADNLYWQDFKTSAAAIARRANARARGATINSNFY